MRNKLKGTKTITKTKKIGKDRKQHEYCLLNKADKAKIKEQAEKRKNQ